MPSNFPAPSKVPPKANFPAPIAKFKPTIANAAFISPLTSLGFFCIKSPNLSTKGFSFTIPWFITGKRVFPSEIPISTKLFLNFFICSAVVFILF